MKSRRDIYHRFFSALFGCILGFNIGVEATRALMPQADTKDTHIMTLRFISGSLTALGGLVYILMRPPQEKTGKNTETQNDGS